MQPFALDQIDDILISFVVNRSAAISALISLITFFAGIINTRFSIVPDAFFTALMFYTVSITLMYSVLIHLLKIRTGMFGLSINSISIILSSILSFFVYLSLTKNLINSTSMFDLISSSFLLILLSILYQFVLYFSISSISELIESRHAVQYYIIIMLLGPFVSVFLAKLLFNIYITFV